VECGGLNKNDPTGSQGVVLLGGVALLEEVCHWGGLCVSLGWALMSWKLKLVLLLLPVGQDVEFLAPFGIVSAWMLPCFPP
jgi:hypothetical protein